MTTNHDAQTSLQRSLNFMDKLCFDENFEFNHSSLTKLVGSSEADFLLSQRIDRQLLYRELVFDSLTSTLIKTFTESLKFFTAEQRQILFRWFLSTQPVKSRHYKDIANEFYDFIHSLQHTKTHSDLHQTITAVFENCPFLFDLFLYERSWHELTFLPDAPAFKSAAADQSLSDSKPVLNPALLLLRFDFDVHHCVEKTPEAALTHIVLVRDVTASKKMEFELNVLGFRLLQHLQNTPQATMGDTLEFFTQSTPDTEIDVIQSDVLELIKTFISHGIILGLE